MTRFLFCAMVLLGSACAGGPSPFVAENAVFLHAAENGNRANEAFQRCNAFVEGWLAHSDPESGLIPRNLENDTDIWNAQDAAADNYPFMVLTAAITDRDRFDGRMLDMLRAETELTSRLGNLPDTYSFTTNTFLTEEIDIERLIFGASEYAKDGLMPLTEWLGQSPWSDRMIGLIDDIWRQAPIETPYGNIPSTSQEVNGEMLQVLSRVYWMTGDRKYLDYALRLADYYLLDHHPTRDESRLRLRDHGCEILSGLTEIYATVHYAAPDRKEIYQSPIHMMLDRVLEVGRNQHGMLYNTVNPQTGDHGDRLADTWGYNYNGFYTVYLLDGIEEYREAAVLALSNVLEHYRDYDWESGSADGDADAIESGLNLYNREHVPSAAEWIDNQIQTMWGKQQADGVVEGWHGDGNFARTSIMYALWKTKGLTIRPWREDVRFGAELQDEKLYVTVTAEQPWEGHLIVDIPRHQLNMRLPLDYPRINQFPEWFTVDLDGEYSIQANAEGYVDAMAGNELSEGLPLTLVPGTELRLVVSEIRE